MPLVRVREDIGLTFEWSESTGFVDISPSPDGHLLFYEGINVIDEAGQARYPFTDEGLDLAIDEVVRSRSLCVRRQRRRWCP